MPDPQVVVPPAFAAAYRTGSPAERAWIESLPDLAVEFLRRWDLCLDGEPMYGMVGLVLPVLRADGTPAAMKLPMISEDQPGEATALRAWGGDGAVRLLDEDPQTWVMLLERLDGLDLRSVADDMEAVEIIAGLLRRLHAHAAPAEVPRLSDVAARMVDDAAALAPSVASDDQRRLIEAWAASTAAIAEEGGDRLLHWDLHYENVLSARREAWLSIDPKPLAGDPGFDLLPALRNRWQDVAADPVRLIRRRFDLMVDVLDLDRDRAAVWTRARLLQNAIWNIQDGEPAIDEESTLLAASMPAV